MFGLGMPEILLILAIALIVIGPKKLPELAKTLGRAMGEFKRSAQDFKRSIDVETTLKDIETPASDLKNIIKEANTENKTVVETDDAQNDDPGDDPDDDPDMTPSGDQNTRDEKIQGANLDDPDDVSMESTSTQAPENKKQTP